MLLLSYRYNISERQAEVLSHDSLSVVCFLGLGADEKAPHHSTLTLFKNRLLDNGGRKAYEDLFDEIIKIAWEKGVRFDKPQLVETVQVVAELNIEKDKARPKEVQAPRDKDATRGAKGNKIVVSRDGRREKKTDSF